MFSGLASNNELNEPLPLKQPCTYTRLPQMWWVPSYSGIASATVKTNSGIDKAWCMENTVYSECEEVNVPLLMLIAILGKSANLAQSWHRAINAPTF